jgi:TfoX/Sxy family transcriptional regulator of competence genes
MPFSIAPLGAILVSMAYSEALAGRIRAVLEEQEGLSERKMFGGLAFMIRGNMCCGVVGDDLMLRVGPERYDDSLARPGARPMDFTGRPMRGMVYVDGQAAATDAKLWEWVEVAVGFAGGLPAK